MATSRPKASNTRRVGSPPACAFPSLAGIVEDDKPRVMPSPVLSREEELYWLALKLVPGLGSRTSGKLLDRFRTPQAIFRASRTELEGAGVSGAIAQSIASGCTFEDAATQHEKMTQCAAVVVTIGDPRYPQALREIFDPPILLFARRRGELLLTFSVGIVGTRRPTPYGLAVAERLAGDLAHAGLTIVSGMARGIDSAAHKGALARGGNTVAVLGCGVDVVYPSENRKLAAELAAKGLIISEFPMGAVAFPISGSRREPRGRAGMRRGCGVSFGKPQAGGGTGGERTDYFGISHGRGGVSAEFPDPQPHYQRNQRGRSGGGGRAVFRFGHYRQAGHRWGPRRVRGAGKHHFQAQLGPQPAD